jgi:hypothetical protein
MVGFVSAASLDRSGPIVAAPCPPVPGFGGFSLSDRLFRGRSASGVQALPARMDLPGHPLSVAAAERSRNRPEDSKRLT